MHLIHTGFNSSEIKLYVFWKESRISFNCDPKNLSSKYKNLLILKRFSEYP